ncbi:UNVERIFIED_CONTAM: hypothetical protein FKN15_074164 [Acipenser sinensis]
MSSSRAEEQSGQLSKARRWSKSSSPQHIEEKEKRPVAVPDNFGDCQNDRLHLPYLHAYCVPSAAAGLGTLQKCKTQSSRAEEQSGQLSKARRWSKSHTVRHVEEKEKRPVAVPDNFSDCQNYRLHLAYLHA